MLRPFNIPDRSWWKNHVRMVQIPVESELNRQWQRILPWVSYQILVSELPLKSKNKLHDSEFVENHWLICAPDVEGHYLKLPKSVVWIIDFSIEGWYVYSRLPHKLPINGVHTEGLPDKAVSFPFLPDEFVSSLPNQSEHNKVNYSLQKTHKAIKKIECCKGSILIGQLGREVGCSTKSLTRYFHQYLGIAPKRVAQIARSNYALKSILSNSFPTLEDMALECGYFDAQHFYKDLEKVMGHPPKKMAELLKQENFRLQKELLSL